MSFETISLSKYGRSPAARCESAEMLSDNDRTGDGAGVGACAWTTTGKRSAVNKRTSCNDRLRLMIRLQNATVADEVERACRRFRSSERCHPSRCLNSSTPRLSLVRGSQSSHALPSLGYTASL